MAFASFFFFSRQGPWRLVTWSCWNVCQSHWPNYWIMRSTRRRSECQGGFSKRLLVGDFKYFLFSPLFGEDFQFHSYFSDGLKPPTSFVFLINTVGWRIYAQSHKISSQPRWWLIPSWDMLAASCNLFWPLEEKAFYSSTFSVLHVFFWIIYNFIFITIHVIIWYICIYYICNIFKVSTSHFSAFDIIHVLRVISKWMAIYLRWSCAPRQWSRSVQNSMRTRGISGASKRRFRGIPRRFSGKVGELLLFHFGQSFFWKML